MISSNHLERSIQVLNQVISTKNLNSVEVECGDNLPKQSPILSAIKILHQTSLEGTVEQQKALLAIKHKIKALNSLLKETTCTELQGIQIALPKTKTEKMLNLATRILRIIATALIDLLLLPAAGILLLIACARVNFNPKQDQIKQHRIPILLLHGSGFNETEWIVGRQFLKKQSYGSVFSLNYDGLVSNDSKKGIEDYAATKISDKIKEIQTLTGSNEIILIGHSMGGMIAGYYAENFAKNHEIKVKHIISIASPWQGTPMVDAFWKLGGRFSKDRETKRHQQMSVAGGTNADPDFRQRLVNQALASEQQGKCHYYSIWSSTDYAVPGIQGRLTEDPRRQRAFSYLGHYALVVWPSVWLQIRSWLDTIYATENSTLLSRAEAEGKHIGNACHESYCGAPRPIDMVS